MFQHDTNPSGTFKIVTTSGYVVSSSGSPNLVASTSSSSAATSFKLAWLPNAGTIQSAATNEYITADQSGTDAIAATKGSASSYETFITEGGGRKWSIFYQSKLQ